MTLTPRNGRDYKSKKAVLQDWNDGKDFTVSNIFSKWDGMAANKRDIERHTAETEVHIRYNDLVQIAVIQLSR